MDSEHRSPRIEPLHREGRPTLNIFATLRHNPELLKGFLALGSTLLQGGRIPEREREIVILRVGYRCQSEYEFVQHMTIGHPAGVTTAEINALCEAGTTQWSSNDLALIAFADELCAATTVSQSTWDSLRTRFDDAQMLELLVLVGYYRLVSGLLNGAQVALEPGAAAWPDGALTSRSAPRDDS